MLPSENNRSRSGTSALLPSQPFDEKLLAKLRSEGKPVFVYFTADYCVTCKVNEAVVLERADTAKLFADKGITVLRGDFSRPDPAIARFLNQQQAVGVPLYLYYPKDAEARKLPQLLSSAILTEAVRE